MTYFPLVIGFPLVFLGIVYPTGNFKAIPIYNTVQNDIAIFNSKNFTIPWVPVIGCDGTGGLFIEEFNDKLYFLYSSKTRDVVTYDLKTQRKQIIPNSGMSQNRAGNVNFVRIAHMIWVRINFLTFEIYQENPEL